MGSVQDREVAESAPTHLSFGENFFFHINLVIVHKKLFYAFTHKKREQNDKGVMSKKRNNNKGNDQ